MIKVCICGGGNLGHVVTCFLAMQPEVQVSLLTRSPQRWTNCPTLRMPDGTEHTCHISTITDNPAQAVSGAELVIMCLPGFAFADEMKLLAPHLSPDTLVGSVVSNTGFFFEARKYLPASTTVFGFQRVPFISRTISYGHAAHLMGTKSMLYACVTRNDGAPVDEDKREHVRGILQSMLSTPVSLLENIYEVSLSNSNPLLHPARMYSLWHDWDGKRTYSENVLFYEEWDDTASQLLIDMDREFFSLLDVLGVKKGSIVPILEYYESEDVPSLTRKLRSIKAFHGIMSPMKQVDAGYIPDISSRYFTEDFLLGMSMIHRLAHQHAVSIPTIDQVYGWGRALLGG